MISLPGWSAIAAIQEGRKRSSRSLPFQLGMTSDAARGMGSACRWRGRGGPPATRPDRTTASASALQSRARNRREDQQRQRAQEAQEPGFHLAADHRTEIQLAPRRTHFEPAMSLPLASRRSTVPTHPAAVPTHPALLVNAPQLGIERLRPMRRAAARSASSSSRVRVQAFDFDAAASAISAPPDRGSTPSIRRCALPSSVSRSWIRASIRRCAPQARRSAAAAHSFCRFSSASSSSCARCSAACVSSRSRSQYVFLSSSASSSAM